MFTCPFCDGFEHQDLPIAVVGDPVMAPHVARFLTALIDRVIVYSSVGSDVRSALAAAGVTVDEREVVRVVGDGTVVTALELADGTVVETGAVFAASVPHPNNHLATALGCTVDQMGFVSIDAAGRTNIDGVWAAGDLTSMRHQMSIAIAQGTVAGGDCAGALILGSD